MTGRAGNMRTFMNVDASKFIFSSSFHQQSSSIHEQSSSEFTIQLPTRVVPSTKRGSATGRSSASTSAKVLLSSAGKAKAALTGKDKESVSRKVVLSATGRTQPTSVRVPRKENAIEIIEIE